MTNLEQLLNHYKAEAEYLKAEIEKCKASAFFKEAQLFFDALTLTNKKIRTLKKLEDKYYEEKMMKEKMMKYYQRSVEKNPSRTYLLNMLEHKQEELSFLERKSNSEKHFQDNDILDEAIEQLLEAVNHSLLLVLNSKEECYFKIEKTARQRDVICVSYVELFQRISLEQFLPKLGFERSESGFYCRFFKISPPFDCQPLKQILGQFIYDVYEQELEPIKSAWLELQ